MDVSKAPSPVYEGDVIVLSCQDAKGYFFSLPPSDNFNPSSYSSVNVYPDDKPLNSVALAFKILPEKNIKSKSLELCQGHPLFMKEKVISSGEEKDKSSYSSSRFELVYGRKIKLLHVSSQKYLSFREQTDTSPDGVVLNDEPHVFRILPSTGNRSRGNTVYTKDGIILESVTCSKKGLHILAVWNTEFESFEFKLAVTKSVFTILSCTALDSPLFSNAIRGASIVTFYNSKRGTYLCGSGSTIMDVLPQNLKLENDDNNFEVYAKKKKNPSLFVSSDCWWQLEKPENFLEGSPMEVGEKCYIKHVLTQKYLAVSHTNEELILINPNEDDNNLFHVNIPSPSGSNNVIIKGSTCYISTAQTSSYLSINESKYEAKHTRIGSPDSIKFELCLESDLSDACYFKIGQVNDKDACRLLRVDNVKYILVKSLEKIKNSDQTTVVNLKLVEHTLDSLFLWLINENTVTAKNYVKMLRANQCLHLLVVYLDLNLENMDQLLKHICKILKAVAKIESHKSHLYLARKSFMNVYIKKLGKGVGIEDFLIELTGDESSIAQSLTDILFPKSVELHVPVNIWKKENLDASTLKLLSKLCFVDGTPDKDLQDSICDRVIKNDELKNMFFSVEGNVMSTREVQLTELCSSDKNINDEDFSFFLAQLSLFSSVCKGLNKNPAIAIVSRWFPCEVVLSVLNNEVIHIKAKSAFLELIVSVYLDEIIIESGTDIDNIWTYYLWKKLVPTPISNQDIHLPLKGANVVPRYVSQLNENNATIVKRLIEIVENEMKMENLQVKKAYDYVIQLLAVTNVLFAYGFCWNVKGEVTFKVKTFFHILQLSPNGNGSIEAGPPDDEEVLIYKLQIKTLQLLKLFYKQYIYLYAEQIMYQFRDIYDERINVTTIPLKTYIDGDITEHLTEGKKLELSRFLGCALEELCQFSVANNSDDYQRFDRYQLNEYQIFDAKTSDGQALTSILESLMLSKNDELKTMSAGLLYDIRDKTKLVLDQVELAYVVTQKSHEDYEEMFSYGALMHDFQNMKLLLQSRVKDIEKEAEEVQNILQFFGENVIITEEDNTKINLSAQNIAFTSGMFAVVMQYVLKFCPTNYTEQKPFLETCCKFLQITCRCNHKSQMRIFKRLCDFLKVKTGVSAVASLLTEVFTNNESLCKAVSHRDISQIFHLASSKKNEIEYIAFFTTLKAIIMPSKLTTGPPLKTVQGIVIKHFSEAHADFYKTIDKIKILNQKTEDEGDNFVKLLKLLHLTDLMATCCIGQIQSAEDICHNSVTLNELINIVTNENIPQIRKIPFVRLIIEGYLQTERESVRSLHALAHTKAFWTHVYHFSSLIKQLSWSTQAEHVYFKRILMFYQTWKQILLKENEALHSIQYFIEGLGPLLIILCQGNIKLTDIKYAKMALEELEKVLVIILKKNKFLLSTKSQTDFWQKCFDSISSVTSRCTYITYLDEKDEISNSRVSTTRSPLEDPTTLRPLENPTGQKPSVTVGLTIVDLTAESPSTPIDDSTAETEEKIINEKLQTFITNYRRINEWLYPKKAITKTGNVGIESHDGINNTSDSASFNQDISSVMDLLHSFYNQLHQKAMTSVERTRLRSNTLTTIQILYDKMYNQIESCHGQEAILQENLMKCQSASGITFLELLFKMLNYHSHDISFKIFKLIYLLIRMCNKTTQNTVHEHLVEDRSFFLTTHQFMTKIIEYLNVRVEERQVEHGGIPNTVPPPHVSVLIDENENIELLEISSSNGLLAVSGVLKVNENDGEALRKVREYLRVVDVVLSIIADLCDGQNRKLQNLMKEQPHYVMSIDIVSDATVLLQKLAEIPFETVTITSDDFVIIMSIMTKTIQALIEMCTGNYVNQQVAVHGQVIDSINFILEIPLPEKNATTVIDSYKLVQCKSIELLQILLEETNVKSFEIIQSISNDINKENIVKFIKHFYKKDDKNEESMYRAYCVMRSLTDFAKEKFTDDEFADLNDKTCHVEINHITEDGSEILTHVYFPFESSRKLTDDEKEKMQDELERDSHEEKLKDLLKWTDSVWKNDQHKRKFSRCLKVTNFYSDLRHWTLILLTVILNILILGLYRVPSAYNCSNSTISNGTEGYVTVPRTWECWSVIEYILLYVFGALHCILAIWMVIEYFIKEGPNFKPDMPLFKEDLFKLIKKYETLKKICDWINDKPLNVDDKSEGAQYFDIYLFGLYTMYRVLFVISSILGLATWGYFYCLCLPYTFIKLNVILHVVKAVRGIATQLIFVALLILSILLIYAVLSFAFMTSFFDVNNNLYCRNLWECYVTVIREGLVNSFGGAIPVTYAEQSGGSFNIYFWRSIIDISFFVIISIIGLEIVTALLVNRFTELREKKDKAKLDQKQVCFICNLPCDDFEKKGKVKGFTEHYNHDHNMYNYIYYILHVKTLPAEERNAIEKYVYQKINKKSIDFFPISKARVLD